MVQYTVMAQYNNGAIQYWCNTTMVRVLFERVLL